MANEIDSGEETLDLFKEPEGYYEPEKQHTFVNYTTQHGRILNLRLVGHNPLWGHHLWNGAKTISRYLEQNASILARNKTVLELGAGAGLPSLICALFEAKCVVMTDYPDEDLIENMRFNITHCAGLPKDKSVHAEGYLWGKDILTLTRYLPEAESQSGFDLLILADLLFNHSEHAKLILTVQQCLKRSSDAEALVFFTPYRPWLLEKDMAFFDLARQAGLTVEKMCEEIMEKVMFESDPGDEKLRRTVFGYSLRWANQDKQS